MLRRLPELEEEKPGTCTLLNSTISNSNPSSYPDIAFIRKNVPIQDVARELGLRLNGHYRAHCWRVENHKNGDRDPSLTFKKKTNRGRCWVCDQHDWSNLDMAMMILGCDFPAAVAWICERFAVPLGRPGKHITQRRQWNPTYRVGYSGSHMEWLVRSGLWSELTASERSVLVVFDVFTDTETNDATISYRGIMRFAGIRSHTTVRRALRRFQQLGVLEIVRSVGGDGFRSVNSYRLTFDSPKFRSIVNEIYRRQREEIKLERSFWLEERKRRKRDKAATLPVKEVPFSTQCSTGQIDATPRVKHEIVHAP